MKPSGVPTTFIITRQFGVSWRIITPEFFRALGVPVLAGRVFNEGDLMDRQLVAMVSESFVERYWPGETGIGKIFGFQNEFRTIVGVVRDIKVRGLERTSEPQMYLPSSQMIRPVGGLYPPRDLLIRTSGDAYALIPRVREIVRQLDAEQPVSNIRMLTDVIANQTSNRRAQLYMLGALALVAVLLTGVGIHGLLAYTVAQRTQEIGVRLALGAEPANVARMIIGEATRLSIWGAVPGFLLAYSAALSMRALLFGVEPADPLTIVAGVVVVVVVTIAGAIVPALRAVRVSPLLAMRAD